MKADAWAKYALEAGITQSQLDGLVTLLENKDLWKESKDLVRLFAALDALGVSEYVEFDPNVVRGLLYYTGTVFEAFDVSGSVHRSLLGGGRYNNLLADVGGDPLSAVGFAMGDVVAGIVLEENDLIPEFEPSPAPVLVTVFGKEFLAESLALSAELRENGIKVISYPEAAKIGKQFKFANKMGVKVALVLGADEVESGQVAVKNLLSGEQVKIARADVPEKVQKILAGD